MCTITIGHAKTDFRFAKLSTGILVLFCHWPPKEFRYSDCDDG